MLLSHPSGVNAGVAVAAELGLFPEISGSHYRASVRFVSWQGLSERARQIEADVPFELICCH